MLPPLVPQSSLHMTTRATSLFLETLPLTLHGFTLLCTCVCVAWHVYRDQRTTFGSGSLFQLRRSWDWTQVIRFSSKYLNPLSPCASSTLPLLSGLAKGPDFHLVWRLEVQKQINSVSDNCISHEKRCTEMMGGGMQGELSNPESCAGLPVNLVNQSEPQMILWNWHIWINTVEEDKVCNSRHRLWSTAEVKHEFSS